MIDSYDFGVMVINGKRYTSDVIVFPEKIIDGWWRREGHKVYTEDLKEILVIGTGYYGLMKISPEASEALKSHEIELVAQPTGEAYQTFNKLLKSNKRVAGAFHLTC